METKPVHAAFVCPSCGADLIVKETSVTLFPVDSEGSFDASNYVQTEVVTTFLVCLRHDYDKGDCEFYRILPTAADRSFVDPALLRLTEEETASLDHAQYAADYTAARSVMDNLLKEQQ